MFYSEFSYMIVYNILWTFTLLNLGIGEPTESGAVRHEYWDVVFELDYRIQVQSLSSFSLQTTNMTYFGE